MVDFSFIGKDGLIIQYEDIISLIGFNVAQYFHGKGVNDKLDRMSVEDILKSYFNRQTEDIPKWLKESFTNPDQLKAYKEKHYIPDVDLSFGNFESFLEAREKLIVAALKKELM